ncbi:MAG TPA: CorA family divalent cation transporter [Steroidobacteraceae bacterium]|nr:CorA family divalent cation transporter [Steroidobacteraceae bacterium]
MSMATSTPPRIVRQFRQIVVWPVQLIPIKAGAPVQRHWEALDRIQVNNPWQHWHGKFDIGAEEFRERHYKEFVTFLPFVQRFLYGSPAGQEGGHFGESSIRVYRRSDVAHARLTFADGFVHEFAVHRCDLYFFHDADVMVVVLEVSADDLPLERVQDVLFRFARAYPAFWDEDGQPGNCMRQVAWLDQQRRVLAVSDYEQRQRYLDHVARYRTPCLASHWSWLIEPLGLEHPGQTAPLRYRQLEYYRMPFMAYLALDDPHALTRADFVRLAIVTRPGAPEEFEYSEESLRNFEADYCDDRFWGRGGVRASGETRLICTGRTIAMVGQHDNAFFCGRETGVLGQFRHQYFLLFLIAHFNKATLLSISDELAVAMDRLRVGDTESVKAFKRTIRQSMEVFLRFTHRYWFHTVSNQEQARGLFRRLCEQLHNYELYDEVRTEVMDMSNYLDTDSIRRQANTVLRLTVVTIFGLIGTIVTGFLGMNLLAEADASLTRRTVLFLLVLGATAVVTSFTIVKSKRLADFIDALSDDRLSWKRKWGVWERIWFTPRSRDGAPGEPRREDYG